MVTFSKLMATPSMKDTQYLEQLVRIYEEAFSPNGRLPVEVIKQRIIRGRQSAIVGKEQNEVVFFALLWPLRGTEFVLLDYMATKSVHRGKGIGTAFFESLNEMAELAGKTLVIESEDPAHGNNREQRERRVRFYRRQGAKELKGVRYMMPGLAGGEPAEMVLMICAVGSQPCETRTGEIEGKAVRELVTQIYREVYNRGPEDELLRSFIGDIGTGPLKLGS